MFYFVYAKTMISMCVRVWNVHDLCKLYTYDVHPYKKSHRVCCSYRHVYYNLVGYLTILTTKTIIESETKYLVENMRRDDGC